MEMCVCDQPKLEKSETSTPPGQVYCTECGRWYDKETWKEDRAFLRNQAAEEEKIRKQAFHRLARTQKNPPKIGRNDPCKCGSGKKYKKCCG